jgi:hypothetical protein
MDVRIVGYDRKIRELYRNSEIGQRLGKVEGIGPGRCGRRPKLVQERASVCGVAWLVPKTAIERRPRQITRHQ